MTPKRRKKSDIILEKENIKDKKEDKVRTLALNFEVLASEENSQNHKSQEIKSPRKKHKKAGSCRFSEFKVLYQKVQLMERRKC